MNYITSDKDRFNNKTLEYAGFYNVNIATDGDTILSIGINSVSATSEFSTLT